MSKGYTTDCGLLLSNGTDVQGERLTDEALDALMEQALGCIDVVAFESLPDGVRFAPAGIIKEWRQVPGQPREITKFELASVGVVWNHADPHAPPIKSIG